MSKIIIAGVDMHDNSLVCKVGVDREEPTTNRFGNSISGRKQFFKHLGRLASKAAGSRVVVAYEASTQGFLPAR